MRMGVADKLRPPLVDNSGVPIIVEKDNRMVNSQRNAPATMKVTKKDLIWVPVIKGTRCRRQPELPLGFHDDDNNIIILCYLLMLFLPKSLLVDVSASIGGEAIVFTRGRVFGVDKGMAPLR
jgi:hypothetical protein